MLSDKGANNNYSETFKNVLDIIYQSKGPEHENLNEALKYLSTEDAFNDFVSNPEFSMKPFLQAINSFTTPKSNLDLNTLKNLAEFFEFIPAKLHLVSQDSQLELISLITACINYFNESFKLTNDSNEEYKNSITKIIESYKMIFKLSIKMKSIENLKMFAEKFGLVNTSEANFICRTFCKTSDYFEKFPDLVLIYLRLTISLSQKNLQSSKPVDSSNFIIFLQIYSRYFMKFKQSVVKGFDLIFGAAAMIKNTLNSESHPKMVSFLEELFTFLSENSRIFDEIIQQQNSFFRMDLFYFKEINLMSKLNLVTVFKRCIAKHLINGHEGLLLSSNPDSQNILDLFMKSVCGDFSEFDPSVLSSPNELIQLEIFSKLAHQNSTESCANVLLRLCSQSYFLPDTRFQSKFLNLLRISLLSRTSDGLTEIIKKSLNSYDYLNVSNLILLSCFPFSLWRSLEKHTIISNSVTDILSIWKFINANESSIDLLSLVLLATANLINEAADIIKKEDLKEIITLLSQSLTLIRNNNSMVPAMKHKAAVSMHKVLRSLLLLKDDKVLDIIDCITKLGSTESCASVFDSWKSLSLLSFIKSNRDSSKLIKTVSERIDMLVPKLFVVSEKMSPGAKLLVQHYYRHALYLHMRYTQDVNFFNNPVIQGETEHLMNYIQDSSLPWSKGVFNRNAEDSIWEFICSNMINSKDEMQTLLLSCPLQISSSLKPTSVPLPALSLLKEDFVALQKLVEDLKERRDNSALYALHNSLQNILKL